MDEAHEVIIITVTRITWREASGMWSKGSHKPNEQIKKQMRDFKENCCYSLAYEKDNTKSREENYKKNIVDARFICLIILLVCFIMQQHITYYQY